MAFVETKERSKDEALETRYYKASYKNAREEVFAAMKKQGFDLYSYNDDYGEFLYSNGMCDVTLKIIQTKAVEVAIDLQVYLEAFMAKRKAKKIIAQLYEAFDRTLIFKGKALNR